MTQPSRLASAASLPLAAMAGLSLLVIPTMIDVARTSWSTEQGGGGPIVLFLAIWLIAREWSTARHLARPGSFVLGIALLVPLLALYCLARITSILEVEGFAMYASLVVTAYIFVGGQVLRRMWFPLLFMLFAFPPPDTLVAIITQPIKIAISRWSVELLYVLGYPVANTGVNIQIGQYQMLVAAACAGLNSLISLTSLGLLYSYIRHRSSWPHMLALVLLILPIAIWVNFLRVLILLLVTYYFGEAAGQGFVHDLAGLTMFALAFIFILALDGLISLIPGRSRRGSARMLAVAP